MTSSTWYIMMYASYVMMYACIPNHVSVGFFFDRLLINGLSFETLVMFLCRFFDYPCTNIRDLFAYGACVGDINAKIARGNHFFFASKCCSTHIVHKHVRKLCTVYTMISTYLI